MLVPEDGEVEPGIAGDAPAVAYEPPLAIAGCSVHVEEHIDRADRGLRVKCNAHPGCRKYASLMRDRFGHGPTAAEIYLGAWLLLATPDAHAHGRLRPTKAQLDRYMDSLA